ncbi:MAG TPA: extensin family protein [Pseudomonas sp.]|nr:extensin family protein [Pseudomonas sp.]
MRWVLLAVLVLALGLVLAVQRGWRELPARWDPRTPLDVRAPPDWLSGWRLWRLRRDPALCAQVLATSQLDYVTQPDSRLNSDCPLRNIVRVRAGEVGLNTSFLATCSLAVSYALFERHGVQPLAQEFFGQPVTRIEHFGSFACRRIGGSRCWSRHATANALDIGAFRLADGRSISLSGHWRSEGDEARFLRALRDAACEHFQGVLGPDYNAAHHDHFHLEVGGFGMCR